jgi:hypothetical protein
MQDPLVVAQDSRPVFATLGSDAYPTTARRWAILGAGRVVHQATGLR